MLSDKLINTLLFSAANHANEAKPFGLSQWQQVRDHYFARAIEAEVRKQDDALIRQMLEALTLTERYLEIEVGAAYGRDAHISKIKEYESRLKKHKKCITAARARLGDLKDVPVNTHDMRTGIDI